MSAPTVTPSSCGSMLTVASSLTQGTWSGTAMGGLTGTVEFVAPTGSAGVCTVAITDGNGQSVTLNITVIGQPTFTTFPTVLLFSGGLLVNFTASDGHGGFLAFSASGCCTDNAGQTFSIASSGTDAIAALTFPNLAADGGYSNFDTSGTDGTFAYIGGGSGDGNILGWYYNGSSWTNMTYGPIQSAVIPDGLGHGYSNGVDSGGTFGFVRYNNNGTQTMLTESFYPARQATGAADGNGDYFDICFNPSVGSVFCEANKNGTATSTSSAMGGSPGIGWQAGGDGQGHVYIASPLSPATLNKIVDGLTVTPITISLPSNATPSWCSGDNQGNVYCTATTGSSGVVWINSSGIASTLTMPNGLNAIKIYGDGNGHAWITTGTNQIVEAIAGNLTTYSITGGAVPETNPYSCTTDGIGALYCIDSTTTLVIKIHS